MALIQFPDEEKKIAQLRSELQGHFSLAERLYSYWLTRPENAYFLNGSMTPWPRTANVPRETVDLAMILNVQLLRLFRSVVEECARGESLGANILARGLYETTLALHYILKDEIHVFVGPTKGRGHQVKVQSSKSVDKQESLTRSQRAIFYIAHDYLSRQKHTRQLGLIPEMATVVAERKAQDPPHFDEVIRRKIGDTWYSILKDSSSWTGLKIRDLATLLGPVFETWHIIVYPVQSHMGHSADALQHFGETSEDSQLYLKPFSTRKEISAVLLISTAMFLGALRGIQDCFCFDDIEKAIDEMHAENERLRDMPD
jgi:hypothetical protein